jgi:hypothetical protein
MLIYAHGAKNCPAPLYGARSPEAGQELRTFERAKYGTVQTKLPTAAAKKVIAGRAGVCGYRKSGIGRRVFGIQVRGLT